MPSLSFSKVEGLGNDFLLVDARDGSPQGRAALLEQLRGLAPMLCNRRRGVGGDGILVVGPGSPGAEASMTVINHDGSRPEMCGNGLRCVALVVAQTPRPVQIETDAGIRHCRVLEASTPLTSGRVRVDMGPAADEGQARPASGAGRTFHRISMGNPHAVTFVGPEEDPRALAQSLGPALEYDPVFLPRRTNVEFARSEPGDALTVWVWERGCGITQACGTGACATAVAACRQGLLSPGTVDVHLPGGSLQVQVPVDSADGVAMTGPAVVVFSGSIALPA